MVLKGGVYILTSKSGLNVKRRQKRIKNLETFCFLRFLNIINDGIADAELVPSRLQQAIK